MDTKVNVDFLNNAKIKQLLSKSPMILDDKNQEHILVFRRVLEIAVSQGRWFGMTSQVS